MPSPEKTELRMRRAQDRGITERGEFIDLRELDPEAFEGIHPLLMMSLEEMVYYLLEDYEPQYFVRASAFLKVYGAAIEDLLCCPLVNRLGGLQQLGVKANVLSGQYFVLNGETRQVRSAPFIHTRLHHSMFVAAHAIVAGLWLGTNFRDTIILVFGALLHDIGHSAFGHDGDTILIAHGIPDHEERGERAVLMDLDIRESMEMADITADEVIQVMCEKGPLGAIQKIIDTLGYCHMDGVMVGLEDAKDLSAMVIRNLQNLARFTYRQETELWMPIVSRVKPLQLLLKWRFELSKVVYYRLWPAKISAAALRTALAHFFQKGQLSREDITFGTDQAVKLKVTALLNNPSIRIPEAIRSAWNLAMGFENDLKDWRYLKFTEQRLMEDFLARLQNKQAIRTIVAAPYDFSKKSYLACTKGQKIYRLTMDAPLPEEHTLWHVLVWTGN